MHNNKCIQVERGFFLLDFFLNKMITEAIVMILIGIIALRMAGRKSLSQMTISQAVIMIAIGSILVEPVKEEGVIITALSIFLFVLVLYCLEMLSLKFPFFEKLVVGKSRIVIENGIVIKKNLKRLRMTTGQLEMILRQNKISEVSDVEIATLEANGQLAYEMFEDAKTLTIGDFKRLTGEFFKNYQLSNEQMGNKINREDLFEKVKEEQRNE